MVLITAPLCHPQCNQFHLINELASRLLLQFETSWLLNRVTSGSAQFRIDFQLLFFSPRLVLKPIYIWDWVLRHIFNIHSKAWIKNKAQSLAAKSVWNNCLRTAGVCLSLLNTPFFKMFLKDIHKLLKIFLIKILHVYYSCVSTC